MTKRYSLPLAGRNRSHRRVWPVMRGRREGHQRGDALQKVPKMMGIYKADWGIQKLRHPGDTVGQTEDGAIQ